MDIISLYNDYSIYYPTEGHKHSRPGWVNVVCPFCTGNPGLHLGYSLANNYFACWRCGWHPLLLTLSKLLGLREEECRRIVRQYGGRSTTKSQDHKVRIKPFKLPSSIVPLTTKHKKYLINRGFAHPSKLVEQWGIRSTGPISMLENINYGHRILIPIYWDGEVVTFQTRATKEGAPLKYMACPLAREEVPHKEILYCKQEAMSDTAIGVEGATDVWKLGTDSFGTFGISYTPKQISIIVRMFKRVTIIYDDEAQAIKQAKKLQAELTFEGVHARIKIIKGDPGALSDKDARTLAYEAMQW